MIPFNRIRLTKDDLDEVLKSLRTNEIMGGGRYSRLAEEYLSKYFCGHKVFITPSGTAALEIMALALNLGAGDEVIVPNFTFTSTANAFALRGCSVVLADIEEETLNICPDSIGELLTERTRAVVPIHYGGVAANFEEIEKKIKSKDNILLLEDAAQCLGSTYNDKPLGAFGHMAALSFHQTKNISSGEGGAIVVQDKSLAERVEIIREKGTNRARFFRGEVDKYTWEDIGSSYVIADYVGALLYSQLQRIADVTATRRNLCKFYSDQLLPLHSRGDIRIRTSEPKNSASNGHIFYVLTETQTVRDSLINWLKQNGVMATFHYVPLSISPAGRKCAIQKGNLSRSINISARLIRLPLYVGLTKNQQSYIVNLIYKFLGVNKVE